VENRTRRLLRSRNRAQCGTERRPISESHLAASVRLRNEILFALSGLDRSPVCADLEAGSGENGDSHPRAEGPTGAVRRVKLRCGLLLSEIRATLILLCGSHARLQNSGENPRTVREDFFRRLSLRVDTTRARAHLAVVEEENLALLCEEALLRGNEERPSLTDYSQKTHFSYITNGSAPNRALCRRIPRIESIPRAADIVERKTSSFN